MDKTDREVMQQALEALELGCTDSNGNDVDLVAPAITALRARLAEPEPEPVPEAWVVESHEVDAEGKPLTLRSLDWNDFDVDQLPVGTRLYTAPPARPLTDEEIDRITRDKWGDMLFSDVMEVHREFARAIERKITGGQR